MEQKDEGMRIKVIGSHNGETGNRAVTSVNI